MSSLRDDLVAFYKQHDSSKTGADIDTLLVKYKGQEENLIAQLSAKYKCSTVRGFAQQTEAAPVSDEKFTGWLTVFYQHYAPQYVPKIPLLVSRFTTDDERRGLTRTLQLKYGRFPKDINCEAARERLVFYYNNVVGDPEKLGSIPEILNKYQGEYGPLFAFLAQKYGKPVPELAEVRAASASAGGQQQRANYIDPENRERLWSWLFAYEPSSEKLNIDHIDLVLQKYQGKLESLWAQMAAKYGAEPPRMKSSGSPEVERQRLIRYFSFYNAAKLPQVDQLLAAYSGEMADDLWYVLASKYGPEPAFKTGDAAALRCFLTMFYRHYSPPLLEDKQKLADVAARYAGNPQELFAQLKAKYLS